LSSTYDDGGLVSLGDGSMPLLGKRTLPQTGAKAPFIVSCSTLRVKLAQSPWKSSM
jgi:hypothetical protein